MKLILCLTFLAVPFFAQADTYFIDEVRGASYGGAEVYKELIRSELRAQKQELVRSPEYSNWIVEPSLLKLGESYVASLSKINNGRVAFSQKLKVQSLDDLDVVTQRLVQAMVSNQSVDSVQQVNTVTQDELVGTTEKTEVERQFYLGFGPAGLSGLSADGSAVNLTAGYLWGLDNQFGMRFGLDWTGGEGDADILNVGLGGQYYFNLQKHAPYVLGLVGFSWAESNSKAPVCTNLIFACDGEDKAGWSAQLGAGYHFFRTAKVNLALEAVYTASFYDVSGENPGAFAGRIVLFW